MASSLAPNSGDGGRAEAPMFDLINEIETQGILPTRWLREAANSDIIFTERYKIPEANFQPATLDLRLGHSAKVEC